MVFFYYIFQGLFLYIFLEFLWSVFLGGGNQSVGSSLRVELSVGSHLDLSAVN